MDAYLTAEYILIQDANDHLLILDTKGETVFKCPSKVERVVALRDNKLIFENSDSEYGLMNLDGETLIRPKYKSLQFMDGDKFLAMLDDYAVVINVEGEESLRLEDYESVSWVGQYGFVAHERKDYVFLDKEGKSVKNAEFEELNGSPLLPGCWNISSDYFNMDAAVNAVVGLVNDNGVGKIKFGAYPSQVFADGSPRYYSGDTNGRINDLDVNGIKYSIYVYGHFTSQIAYYNYSYYSSSGYVWGDGSLDGFSININTQSQWGFEGSEALLKAFERNGYKLLRRTGKNNDAFAALLHQGDKLLFIRSEKDSSDGVVWYVKDDGGYQDYFEYLINTAEESGSDDCIGAVEVVEEAVADTVYAYAAE